MNHQIKFMLAMLALILATGVSAKALTDAERDARYSACFDFKGLVTGGTVQPHWRDNGSLWWVAGADTLAVDGNGQPLAFVSAWLTAGKSVPADKSVPTSKPPLDDPDITETLPGPGDWTALIINNDLWLAGADGQPVRMTSDGTEDRPWLLYGAQWSPDGTMLAVFHWNLGVAPTIPMIDWLDPLAPVERDPATQSDQPRMTADLHVVHAADQRVVVVHDDPTLAEPRLELAGWVPGTGEVLAILFNRVMNRQDLLAIDPGTGAWRTIIAERSETFIDGLAASFMLDGYVTPLDDGERFIWLSERDGFHHLFLYRWNGELERQLTRGDFPVLRIEGIDLAGGWIYFLAKPDSGDPTSQHLCRVDLEGRNFRQLTTMPGRRSIHLSPDFGRFVENHSDIDRPAAAVLRRSDGEFLAELAQADPSQLEAMDWTPPTRAVVKAADGESDCFCAVYLPPEFDPALKYPVIEVIYAGPQWMIVPRRMPAGEYGDTAAALAQLGYVTVIVDSPGTAGIGRAYQDEVFGRLGQFEIFDHVAAIKNLAADRPWMDLDRVGIHGKSWGGYFALRALLVAPEFYRAGVASSLIADLATAPDGPIVPYMGRPADNPEAYAAADCLPLADRLEGKLLITIGTNDRNTFFGHSMRMMSAFIEAGKDVDMLVLPGQHHWLQGASFLRWQRAMRDHFRTHLRPDPLPRPN